jgi:hypothetical protein
MKTSCFNFCNEKINYRISRFDFRIMSKKNSIFYTSIPPIWISKGDIANPETHSPIISTQHDKQFWVRKKIVITGVLFKSHDLISEKPFFE